MRSSANKSKASYGSNPVLIELTIARYFTPALRRRILSGTVPGWLQIHPRKNYIMAAALSCPEWVDRDEIRELRNEARRRSAETGVLHVLDHIIPLNHPDVCGLTVPWNLRVITWAQNATKSNNWNPHQLELFA